MRAPIHVVFAASLAIGGGGAALAETQSFQATMAGTVSFTETIDIAEGHQILAFTPTFVSVDPPGTGVLAGATAYCAGIAHVVDEIIADHRGHCRVMTPAGDSFVLSAVWEEGARLDGPFTGAVELLPGSGKFAELAGEGTARWMPLRPAGDNMAQGIFAIEGELSTE